MKYLMLWRPAGDDAPPTEEHMQAMGAFVGEAFASGWLLETGSFLSGSEGGRVVRKGSEVTAFAGSFADGRPEVRGYALVEAASNAAALELARRFVAVAGDGESEMFPMEGSTRAEDWPPA